MKKKKRQSRLCDLNLPLKLREILTSAGRSLDPMIPRLWVLSHYRAVNPNGAAHCVGTDSQRYLLGSVSEFLRNSCPGILIL